MHSDLNQREPLPVIAVDSAPLPRRIVLIIVTWLIAFFALAVVWYDLGGYRDYREGLRNEDGAFFPVIGILCWGLCFLFNLGISIWVVVKPNEVFSRLVIAGATLFLLFVCIGTAAFRDLPHEGYQRGFVEWTKRNVNADAIRVWIATNPASKTPAKISAPFPPLFAGLSPANVTVLPNNAGVVIEWGKFGSWRNARRVVIMTDPNASCWQDPNGHFPADPIAPGVFGGMQWTN